MKLTRSTIITGLAILVLAAAIPSAIREALDSGRIYLFSWEFLADLPKRLTGPGRLRFILQPAVAILLGLRGGLADARAGRPPYLYGLFFHAVHRWEYLRSGLTAVRDILAIGIILDVVAQFLIFRQIHPGAALLIGPVLITAPYALARAVTNRVTRLVGRRTSPGWVAPHYGTGRLPPGRAGIRPHHGLAGGCRRAHRPEPAAGRAEAPRAGGRASRLTSGNTIAREVSHHAGQHSPRER